MNRHSNGKGPGYFSTALYLFVSLALLPFALLAQNPRGTLRGVVQDIHGGRVPAAKVVVQAAESSLQRETSSDSRGEFRLDDLLPGVYHLLVNAPGFAKAGAEISVVVSSVREITVTLKPQSIQQTVNVEGQASSITTKPIPRQPAAWRTSLTWLPARNRSSPPIPPRRASLRFPRAAAPV